jgi:hypothetical protein
MFEKPGGVTPHKKMPVVPVNKVVDEKKNNRKKVAEEEEKNFGPATPRRENSLNLVTLV